MSEIRDMEIRILVLLGVFWGLVPAPITHRRQRKGKAKSYKEDFT